MVEKKTDNDENSQASTSETDLEQDMHDQTVDEATTVNNDESLESLQETEMEQLRQEKEEIYDRMLRVQAEFDNYKRRSHKEKVAERKYKSQDLANELLPVLDNFERALQIESTEETDSIIEGITMVYQQFLDALKSQGIEVIDCIGKSFDPNLHHAVMQVDDEDEESNVITEELQKGYMLEDRVLRPSMVKVNK